MSEAQNSNAQKGKILLIAGSLCTLLGLFMYSLRFAYAELFLGARFLFGIPIQDSDTLKVLVVAAGSFVMILKGLIILGVGLAFYLKSSAPQTGTSHGTAS